MCNEQKNVYVVELDMKNKSVKDIAREAALQIIGITDGLLEQQTETIKRMKEVIFMRDFILITSKYA